jgi:hypothetical protein
VAIAVALGALLLVVRVITVPAETRTGDLISIPTAPRADGDGCRLALLSGTLTAHPAWGVAVSGGNVPQLVFWPNGWSAERTDDGANLIDQEGRVVARTGDDVRAAGGLATFGGREGFAVCASDLHFEPAAP